MNYGTEITLILVAFIFLLMATKFPEFIKYKKARDDFKRRMLGRVAERRAQNRNKPDRRSTGRFA